MRIPKFRGTAGMLYMENLFCTRFLNVVLVARAFDAFWLVVFIERVLWLGAENLMVLGSTQIRFCKYISQIMVVYNYLAVISFVICYDKPFVATLLVGE